LDFDRTICTTKNGSSPLHGRHSIDSDLLTLLTSFENVKIVTRNPHEEDIKTFLKRKGVPPTVPVYCVKQQAKKSKAFVIQKFSSCKVQDVAESSAAEPQGIHHIHGKCAEVIFVDDDIEELIDPEVVDLDIIRFLYRRIK